MIRKFCSLVFCVIALLLLLAGCSNHPPSAAQFMNVKKDRMSFVVGGTVRTGNVDNREVSYGPKNNTAHDQYYSYEEGYWNLDLVWFAATSHVVLGLALEDYTYRMFLGPRFQYFGVQGWAGLSPSDRRKEKDNPKVVGGVMLIEQFPISEKIKVGLSEHISRNSYKVINHTECCSMNEIYAEQYAEFGIGTYLTYKNFSFEFRYGREIGEPRNRFYFMTHYAFFN